jgi:tetratricopeptide (TPR) repeat protein
MERVLSLVKSLRESEIRLVRAYYQGRPEQGDADKREKLFVLALSKPDCTDKEARKYLFGRKDATSFAVIKQRLKTDILNILLLQEAETKFKSKYAQSVFSCRRYIIQGELLLSRGVYDEAMDVLLRASDLAYHNELYAEQVMINDIYRTHLVMKEEGKNFGRISRSIDASVQLLGKSVTAKHDHYELTVPGLFRTTSGHHLNGEGKVKLAKMKTDFETTGSLRIGFYYYLSAMHYYSMARDFPLSLHNGLELLRLVKSSPAFQSDSFLAGANMEIANALINLGRYGEALEHANVALERFKPGMLNELLALEKVYFCYIRQNDLRAAQLVVDRAFQNQKISYNEFLNSKWWYFKAGLEFLAGQHKKALLSLKNCDELMKDKGGWLLGFCMLEVMCRIENGNHDWFDYRIESLKKIIKRYVTNAGVDCDHRIEVVFRLVRALRRVNYDFAQLCAEEQQDLALLAKGEGGYYWNPAGYELVRFDAWITGKAGGAPAPKLKGKRATKTGPVS